MPFNASNASSPSRIEALKVRHHKLSKIIETEQNSFVMNDQEIARLKREKLYLKEKIEGIRKVS